VSEEQASAALNRALDMGVNFIDTARAYGDSEHKIGLALGERHEEYVLATKTHSRDYAGAMQDLESSLRELRTGRIDPWQLHNVMDRGLWEQDTQPDGALAAAKKARAEGMVDHITGGVPRSVHRV